MSNQRLTFIEKCRAGRANVNELEDAVAEWHSKGDDVPLHEFLGLTWEEYQTSAGSTDRLKDILAAKVRSGDHMVVVYENGETKVHEFATRDQAVAFAQSLVLKGVGVSRIAYFLRQPLKIAAGI